MVAPVMGRSASLGVHLDLTGKHDQAFELATARQLVSR
jgi:hypothetical protein